MSSSDSYSEEEKTYEELVQEAKEEAEDFIKNTQTKKVLNEKEWVEEINRIKNKNINRYSKTRPWFEDYMFYQFILQNPVYFYYAYDKYSNLLNDVVENLEKINLEYKQTPSETSDDYYLDQYYFRKIKQLQQDIVSQQSLFDTLPAELIEKIGLEVEENGNLPNFFTYYPRAKEVMRPKGRLDVPKDVLNEIMSHLTIPELKKLGLSTSSFTLEANNKIEQRLLRYLKDKLPKIKDTDDIQELIKDLFELYYDKKFEISPSDDEYSIIQYDNGYVYLNMDLYHDKNNNYSVSYTLNQYDVSNRQSVHRDYSGPEWLFNILFKSGAFKIFNDVAYEEIKNWVEDEED